MEIFKRVRKRENKSVKNKAGASESKVVYLEQFLNPKQMQLKDKRRDKFELSSNSNSKL